VFYSILLIAAIATMLYVVKRWQTLPAEQRKDFGMKALLWGSAAIVLALVLAGRTHWLMGVLAALIALAGRAVQLAHYVPLFKKLFGEFHADAEAPQAPVSHGMMSRREAADILGVDEDASANDIRLAHKKLMQKMHPDRGGTDALATQINKAKEILLKGAD